MFPKNVRHFARKEWPKDPDRVSPDLILEMDDLRERAGVPIRINVAWDDAGHVDGSGHYQDPAVAVDFVFLGLTFLEQLRLLESGRFSGIGFYPAWNTPGWHADLKPRKTRAFWVRTGNRYMYFPSSEALAGFMGWTAPEASPTVPALDGLARYGETILHAAAAHHLPPALVRAMVLKESGGDTWAHNSEPRYRWLWDVSRNAPFRRLTEAESASEIPPADFPAPTGVDPDTEWSDQQSSWGPMQVMGSVARELGFSGRFLTALCDPATGLEFGCRQLAGLRKRFGSEGWPAVVRAYNAGPGGRHDVSNSYPTAVLEKLGGRWPDEPA